MTTYEIAKAIFEQMNSEDTANFDRDAWFDGVCAGHTQLTRGEVFEVTEHLQDLCTAVTADDPEEATKAMMAPLFK